MNFKRGFSVIPHQDAKDLILLLYKRFHYISNCIDHLIVFPHKNHLNDAVSMLNRVNKTFEKMLGYTKTAESNGQDTNEKNGNIRIKI